MRRDLCGRNWHGKNRSKSSIYALLVIVVIFPAQAVARSERAASAPGISKIKLSKLANWTQSLKTNPAHLLSNSNADFMSGAAGNSRRYRFKAIDYPGAGFNGVEDVKGTLRRVIMVGGYALSAPGSFPAGVNGVEYAGKKVRTINFPGSTGTFLLGISPSEAIVGAYSDNAGVVHGFLRKGGFYTTIDFPGGTFTSANSINSAGEIVGEYTDSSGIMHGFYDIGGVLTNLDYPGAISTSAFSINAAAEIVGQWIDTAGMFHGFIYREGKFTSVDSPGAAATIAAGLNDKGHIVGVYADGSGFLHGFLDVDGIFSTVDVPGASGGTVLIGIGDEGQIVGEYTDYLGEQHGVLATPVP